MQNKPIVVKLTYESLIAILQGKELKLLEDYRDDLGQSQTQEYIFKPPFDGILLSRADIQAIKYSESERVFNLLTQVSEHKEKAEVDRSG